MELLIERAKNQSKARKRSFLKKHILQLAGHVTTNVSKTFVHRVTKGPLFPNFTFRNELFYQLMVEIMDKHYLLSWQEWRHLMPVQPIPRWHLRRTKVVLKNGLKTEFITYIPRRKRISRRRSKSQSKPPSPSHSTDDESAASNGHDEEDMFYGDAEDFEDDNTEKHTYMPDSRGRHKHKLDGVQPSPPNHKTGTVSGETVNEGGSGVDGRHVKDIGFDTPTIIYFHGGGFCFGSVPVYRRWLWNFSRKLGGIRIFAVDYSLAPEAPFPIALKQALDAYLWLTDPNGAGVSPQNVIIGGDSAGGNLVASLMLLLRQMRLEKELQFRRPSHHGADVGQQHGCSDFEAADAGSHQLAEPEAASTAPSQPSASPQNQTVAIGPTSVEPAQATARMKGKEVNEMEQICGETSEQKQERQLDFDEENAAEAEDERRLHRQLRVRRESVADLKSSADRLRHHHPKGKESHDAGTDETASHHHPQGPLREEDAEAAEQPTLKAINYDMEIVRQHRIPFELDPDQVGRYPSLPIAAIQISPWVDVSENSEVHSPESWGNMTFRPYNISVRFALAYLGLEATDPPQAKRKEKETRHEWNGIVKLFHQRKSRRRRRGLKGADEAAATPESTQIATAPAAAGTATAAVVPKIFLDDEPMLKSASSTTSLPVSTSATSLLTPTDVWRDRLRRSNSMLSSTNLLARSAAWTAGQVGEREIAISGNDGDLYGKPSVPVFISSGSGSSSGDGLAGPSPPSTLASTSGSPPPLTTFDVCSPYISPVYGDFRGFPPLFVTAGDVEPLLGDIRRYFHKAVDAGVEAEFDLGKNMNHDYQFFFSAAAMSDPEIPRFWNALRTWVHRQLEREVQPTSAMAKMSTSSPPLHN